MADRFKMKRRRYSEFETNGGEVVDVKTPDVYPLKAHEKCFIYRRREGMTQQECADELGVARFWLMQMETGKVSCERLEKFWNER